MFNVFSLQLNCPVVIIKKSKIKMLLIVCDSCTSYLFGM